MGAEHGSQRGLELGDLGGDVLVEQRGALDVRERDDEAVALILKFDCINRIKFAAKNSCLPPSGRRARAPPGSTTGPPRSSGASCAPSSPGTACSPPESCDKNEIKALVTQ